MRFKGWDFIGNVFLASLSFANYLLWHDVKYKSDRFRAHPIVRSLINNRLELPEGAFDLSDRSSDEAYIGEERMYLPISADSSQYSAIYDSLSKSFVLHGPPGTGKSQTITNIIANNIVRGRRVLFVAEKMAALSVVHRRLQNIGLGDFCLELHSNKANKTQVLNHIISTLSLAESTTEQELSEKAAEIAIPLEKLQKELDAMHRKRYLGFSLYQAILDYFANENAPDCLNIDSLFYEKLTESSFNNYLEVLTELSLRAKECGDIEKSPFRHIGGFTYDDKLLRDCELVQHINQMELKPLRQYARALLPLFNMRTVSLTSVKLKALYDICKLLGLDAVVGIGGDGTWNYSYTYIFAGSQIKLASWDGVGTHALIFDTSNHCVRPATIVDWDLGNVSYPFGKVWCESVTIRNIGNDGFIGFNGGTFEIVASGSSVNRLGSSTYYWDTGYISKLYLSSSCYLSASGSNLQVNGTTIGGGADPNMAGKEVRMGGSTTYYITATTGRQLRPSSSSSYYAFYLGTSSYYWHYAYIGSNTVKLGSSTSSKLGFFSATPVTRQTVSSSATVATLISALKKYGLIG